MCRRSSSRRKTRRRRTELRPAPAAEDQAAEGQAEPERADREGADRQRLARGREALPAAEHLHFGTREERALEHALAALLERVRPELVVASGDLTHRGQRDQHERAAHFLRSLGPPVLAIPGNHDIPYTFPARFTRPWREFERLWETTEPTYSSDGLFVLGLNSVRPWRHQSGALRREHLRRACETLNAVPDGAFKIVTFHHHLLGAPWRSTKKPVAERNRVLATLRS